MTKSDLLRMGKRIKKHILKENPSLEKFGNENGISKKTLYHIVNGERDPRISTLKRIRND